MTVAEAVGNQSVYEGSYEQTDSSLAPDMWLLFICLLSLLLHENVLCDNLHSTGVSKFFVTLKPNDSDMV